MRVPCRWLAEYVTIELDNNSVERLANRLTLAGLEVERITYTGDLRGGVVGRVISVRPHPDSNRLSLARVDIGTDEVELVCGADNVVSGKFVPVVSPGGQLPGGMRIEERRIRGISSPGMICSKQELGLEEQSAGIWNFDPHLDLAPGTGLKSLLEFDDWIIDISVPSNRPDCLGIYGIAREVAAITDGGLSAPSLELNESATPVGRSFSVEIADPADTLRYCLSLMEGVHIGPSPLGIQHRLLKAGMRPISNVVDVTNYVMLELGQPLHPFDADLIKGKITVRRAHPGERFRTLDEVDHELTDENLMITDESGNLAVAGVMGGERSEINEGTTRVLLESAAFDPVTIRLSARSVGISSEAAGRFERGVDPEGVPVAAARTAHLLQELTGCTVRKGSVDAYPRRRAKMEIPIRPARVSALLGVAIEQSQLEKILNRLEIETTQRDGRLLAIPPSFRADLSREVDLIEEVGRVYGYDRIPSVAPRGTLHVGKKAPMESFKDRVRTILIGSGMNEVVTDGFGSPGWRGVLSLPDSDLVKPCNPMTVGRNTLRDSLLPGILATVELNLNRGVEGGMLFEVGRVFSKSGGEQESLAGIGFGRTGVPLAGKQEIGLLEIKGILTSLFSELKLEPPRFTARDLPPFLHPGKGAIISLAGEAIGIFGGPDPTVAERLPGVPELVLFEIDLGPIARRSTETGSFVPLPKFPVSKRDLSLLVPADIPEETVRETIVEEKYVDKVLLYDLYHGEQVGEGNKSLTYELVLRADGHTLTDEEVEKSIGRIERRLARLSIHLRG